MQLDRLKITAAIIAKNEESNILNCINSVKNIVNEIIVVDTGSDDSTPQIATRNGAKVFFNNWDNDFSKARNFALEHASNEWILSIDCDEIIECKQIHELSKALGNPNIGGYRIFIRNYLDISDSSIYSVHYYTRLFRNLPQIKYEGRVHEQIHSSIDKCGLEIIELNHSIAYLHHYGYSDNNPNKAMRNIDLLQKEIDHQPNDLWLNWHLAESLFAIGNHKDSKEVLLKIIKYSDLDNDLHDKSSVRLAQISIAEGSYSDVLFYTNNVVSNSEWNGLRLFIRAVALTYLRKYELAKDCLNFARNSNSGLIDLRRLNELDDLINQVI